MSEREGYDFSPQGLLEEFEAVMDSLPRSPVALYGSASGVHVVVRYAVEHPERVSCICLHGGWVRGPDYLAMPGQAAYRQAVGTSWDVAREYFVAIHGQAVGSEAEVLRAELRQTTEHAVFLNFVDAFAEADITEFLPRVSVPTLVNFEPNHNFVSLALTRSLAERIPGARLRSFEDKSGHQVFADFVLALQGNERGRPSHPQGNLASLSPRELEVLALLAKGKSNREISECLVIAEATVTRHVHNILTKLEVSNRVEAATWWVRNPEL